jgi:hypothetical protein
LEHTVSRATVYGSFLPEKLVVDQDNTNNKDFFACLELNPGRNKNFTVNLNQIPTDRNIHLKAYGRDVPGPHTVFKHSARYKTGPRAGTSFGEFTITKVE